MARRWLALVVAAVGVVMSLAMAPASSSPDDVCSAVPLHTVVFGCGGLCAPHASCVLQDERGPSPCSDVGSECVMAPSRACEAQCFESLAANATSFTFYITLSTAAVLNAANASSTNSTGSGSGGTKRPNGTTTGNVTSGAPFESNEFVRRVGELALPTSITNVTVSGGSALIGTRGVVAVVELDSNIFHAAPQVTSVALVNIDLSGREATIAAIVPSNVKSLDLHNTKMKHVPTSLETLAKLDTLILDVNEIAEIPSSVKLAHLKSLHLVENEITAFSASISSLEILDLTNNRLEAFPYDALDSAANLRVLRLGGNPTMHPVVFSATQFKKMSSLEEFTIDSSVLDHSSCSTAQLQSIQQVGMSVCVLSDSEWATRSGSSHTTVLIVSLVAVVVVVGAAAVIYCVWRRKQRAARGKSSSQSHVTQALTTDFERMDDDNNTRGSIELASTNGQPLHPSRLDVGDSSPRYRLSHDDDFHSHRITNDLIEDICVIGHGGFAVVWLVQLLPTKRLLASKRLVQDQVTRQQTIKFVVEIKLNMQLVHPSIVEFVGVAWRTSEADLQVLYEYMTNGDLRTHLDSTDPSRSPWGSHKLHIAIDIIEALVYVHSFSPPLVHRDLKSSNVLLADDMKAKLCDFGGVSRFATESNAMTTSATSTAWWLAPELVAGSANYDESCDIYAFGVILSELDTHGIPYADVGRLSEIGVLQQVAQGHVQPKVSGSCPDEIRQITQHCLAFNPADRPTAIGIAYALRRLRNDWEKHGKVFQPE